MKKIFKTASAVILAMSLTTPVFAAPSFSDINSDNFAWAKPYITSMAGKGLISGYEDGTYRPDNDVTRQETLSLFARAMGSGEKANEPVVEIAHEKYDTMLANYGLTWGTDEIAYLLYKGALKKTDLDTYLKGNEKSTPMKRCEAAIIITKALGGEDEALSDLGVVLDYTDAREVPANAIQYVAYAGEAGIMEGMGDGTFSPNTAVKRSQIAVMLSRTVEKTNYEYKRLKITDVDSSAKRITASDGNAYAYSKDTVLMQKGVEIRAEELSAGVNALFTFSNGTLINLDILSDQPDQTITGRYVNNATTSGKTVVRITPEGETEARGYECDENLSVTYDGSPATLRSFTKGDIMTLSISNGKIVSIKGETKVTKIANATVLKINVGDKITITISHGNAAYDGQTYIVSDNVSVKKNDAAADLDQIYMGDKVTLELEYGVITSIRATSSRKVVEGTIKALTFSSTPTMVVEVKGVETTYQIPNNIDITVNGEEATLYDFRVNDQVKLTLDSDAITKIVATVTQESPGNITGVVTGINSSYGVISVLPSGAVDSKQIFCKDSGTTFVGADGKSKKMGDIKVGQTVDIRGKVSNGVFVGQLVVIVAE